MPTFYPEGNLSLPSDNEMRSLHKIVDLLGGGIGVFTGGGGGAVFFGNYGGGTPTQTPTNPANGAVAIDLDAPNPIWYWNGSAWF